MSWAPYVRMTWSYGQSGTDGATHIILRRAGTHAVLSGDVMPQAKNPERRKVCSGIESAQECLPEPVHLVGSQVGG